MLVLREGDIVDKKTRSRMMSAIRGKNTRIELLVRRYLFKQGFRFRIHDPKLPGKPDIVLPRYKTVIQIHGCFWHAHDCSLFKMPSSNIQSWENKFEKNKANDRKSHLMLSNSGWRILTVWECALRSTNRFMNENEILTEIAKFITSEINTEMISETGMQTNINHYPQPVYPS